MQLPIVQHGSRRRAALLVSTSLAAAALLLLVPRAAFWSGTPGELATGLRVRAHGAAAAAYPSIAPRIEILPARETAARERVRVVWRGHWFLPEASRVRFAAAGAGDVEVAVGGRLLLGRSLDSGTRAPRRPPRLRAGLHSLQVTYTGPAEPGALNLALVIDEAPPRRLPFGAIFPERPSLAEAEAHAAVAERAGWSRQLRPLALALLLVGAVSTPALLPAGPARMRGRGSGLIAGTVLAAGATGAWYWLLWGWFRDRGIPRPEGLPAREASVVPALFLLAVAAALLVARFPGVPRRVGQAVRALAPRWIELALLLPLLVVAALWQAPFWLHADGAANSDTVMPGLAGLRMLDGAPVPAFIYTGLYSGNLSGHLMALVSLAKGTAANDLILVTRILWLVALAVHFLLLARVASLAVAGGVGIWLALAPLTLVEYLNNPEYAEALAFVSMVIALLVLRVRRPDADGLWSALAGLLSGLAIWSQLGTIPALGAAWAVSWWTLRPSARALLAAGLGGLWGIGPVLVGWWGHGDAVRDFFVTGSAGAGAFDWSTRATALGRLLAGTWEPGALAWLAAAITVMLCGWGLLARDGAAEVGPTSRRILAGVTLATLLAFCATGWGTGAASVRYLLVLYLAVPALAAGMLASLLRRWRPALVAAVILTVMTAWSALGWGRVLDLGRQVADLDARLSASMETFVDGGLRRCYAPYWDAYLITFVSLERIRCDSMDLENVDLYREQFVAAPEYPYVARVARNLGDFDGMIERLQREGIDYRVIEAAPWVALLPEPPPPPPD